MPKHIWSVLCYKGCLDQFTNQVSLLDVIEIITIRSKTKPAEPGPHASVPIKMHLVSLWTRSHPDRAETVVTRILIQAPDGSKIPGSEVTLELEKPSLRNFMSFTTMPFRGPGQYIFVVQYRSEPTEPWQVAVSIPIEVRVEGASDKAPSVEESSKEETASR